MKKVNRKIISIFLLLIIIASQMGSAVIATENNTTLTKTLEQYLIENGVDTDGDKRISDAEWAKVKNLDLYGWSEKINDFTGLEKAVNLQYLELTNCNVNIDFSKFINLEKLTIDPYTYSKIDFTKLTHLKQLEIRGTEKEKSVIKLSGMNQLEELTCNDIYDLDISELENLENLDIYDCIYIKLPKFNKLSSIKIYNDSNVDGIIDLQNCEEIYGEISSEIGIEKIKLNENTMITKDYSYFRLENLENEINIELNKNYELGNGRETYKLVRNENDNVAIFNNTNYAEIKAKNVGTTNMTVKDILGREKIIKVNVYERKKNNPDTKLENTGITAKFIDYNTILKSNGELWKINSSTTAEKADENVRAYKTVHSDQYEDILYQYEIYEDKVYSYEELERGGAGDASPSDSVFSELTLKNDNSLNIKSTLIYHEDKDIINKIKNVQTIGNNSYLTTDGKVYKININYITEELKTELIKENVKKLLDDCIVLNDGTTWYIDKYNGKYECKKLADFEIESMGLYPEKIEGYWFDYDYIVTVVDKENNLWCCKDNSWGAFNDSGLKILKESSKWHKRLEYKESRYIKILENGDAVLKENNKKIMDNVSEGFGSYWEKYAILIRTDGTIWTYNIEDGLLTKITESASGDEEENKDFLNPTAKIHEKELGNTSILYGISDSTKIEDFKKQNNFNSTYEVKIYDKNDKELQDNNIIGTGSKVKLYKQGKIVKEYTVILYGDTTGDGKITSVDALAIIKHINNKIPFTKEEYIEAGKVRKESGKNLTSVDALATVKSVNGKYEITKNK